VAGAVADEDVGVVVGHAPALVVPPHLRRQLELAQLLVELVPEHRVLPPRQEVEQLVLGEVDRTL